MEMYQIEQQVVEQYKQWNELRKYVETQAGEQQAHEIEESLFRHLLKLGKSLLSEIFARFNAEILEHKTIDNGKGGTVTAPCCELTKISINFWDSGC